MRTYSQRFNGNQFTWGKNAVAENASKAFRYAGYGLGLWNAVSIYTNNQMSTTQKGFEQGSNLISTFGGPVYGTAWTIGWKVVGLFHKMIGIGQI